MHRVRRLVLLGTLVALLAGGAPADAAPRRFVIRDGFTATGRGGSQVRVRLTAPLTLPGPFGYTRTFGMKASAGPVAGFALVGEDVWGWAVQSTPHWTCRSSDCGPDARLVDSQASSGRYQDVLPAGDYVLVLIGAPGAQVQITAPPFAKNGKPARVWTTHFPTPAVQEAEVEPATVGAPAQQVASGEFRPRRMVSRALIGVMHTVSMFADEYMDYSLRAGTDAGACRPHGKSGTRGGFFQAYRTQAVLGPAPEFGGELCATWSGVVAAPLAEQRGVGLYLPIVL